MFHESVDKRRRTWCGKTVDEMTREELLAAFNGLANLFDVERERNSRLEYERVEAILGRS